MEKICCKCKIKQPLNNFGLLKSSSDGLRYDCKQCRKQYRQLNKDAIKEKQNAYYQNNKEILLEKNKIYRQNNIAQIKIQRKEYRNREDVKKRIKKKNNDYKPIRNRKIQERRRTDLNFQISEILRSKIHKMLSGKNTSYQTLIGCDLEHLKKWLEFRFEPEMNWNNLGIVWQIDHILPINGFNFENALEQQICFHWTNLQPLKAFDNMSKSDTIQLHHYCNNIVNINRFNSKYNKFLGYQVLNKSLEWLRDKRLRYGKNASYDLECKF
jgi:hypothetical protein